MINPEEEGEEEVKGDGTTPTSATTSATTVTPVLSENCKELAAQILQKQQDLTIAQ